MVLSLHSVREKKNLQKATIQMNTTEQINYVVRGGPIINFVSKAIMSDHSNESYCAQEYFHVLLFITLYNVILTFTSLDEIFMKFSG